MKRLSFVAPEKLNLWFQFFESSVGKQLKTSETEGKKIKVKMRKQAVQLEYMQPELLNAELAVLSTIWYRSYVQFSNLTSPEMMLPLKTVYAAFCSVDCTVSSSTRQRHSIQPRSNKKRTEIRKTKKMLSKAIKSLCTKY